MATLPAGFSNNFIIFKIYNQFKALRAEILRNILIAKELENEKEPASDEKLDIPAENPETLNASQTTNANTPNKKSKKRKHKMQKPKHQKW